MPKTTNKLEDFMYQGKLMLTNVQADQEILQALAGYGFTAQKLQEGQKLYDEVSGLVQNQKEELGKKRESTNDFNQSWEDADNAYTKALKVARIALQSSVKAQAALLLYGYRKNNFTGWYSQAEIFYSNLIKEPDYINSMSDYGYTAEKLSQEFDLVKKAETLSLKQQQGSGLSKDARERRDKKITELDRWLSDLRAIAKIALDEHPQKLTSLGIQMGVIGRPRGQKTATTSGSPKTAVNV